MVIKQKGLFRIVTMEAYNGCEPITVYMVQRLEKERAFLPDKWVNVKGFEDRKKAESLFEMLA